MFKRLIASLICITFSFINLQYVQADDFSINQLPIPGTMIGETESFTPLALKGLVVNPQKPLEFQFIVDTGKGPQDTASVKDQANQLVKYFLAGLTIPEGDLWVNLSPYEKNRMVPRSLGQTYLGRDLLAQDYILKQLTASLIYPEKDLGKEFWSMVYAKAQEQFGTTNIPVNTFNKVWILPNEAQVFENGNAAYVTKSTLKVMLDEDYLAKQKHRLIKTASISSQVVREIVIPEITKEVNIGKNFAPLRQIYQALILAKWYKESIQNGLLDTVYTNKNKVVGVDLNDPAIKDQIYERYLKAYKKGAFNYIKEDPTPDGQVVPKKYFSGGTRMVIQVNKTHDVAMLSKSLAAVAGIFLSIAVSLGALPNTAFAQKNTLVQSQIQVVSRMSEAEFQQMLTDFKIYGDLSNEKFEELRKLGIAGSVKPLLDMLADNSKGYLVAEKILSRMGVSNEELVNAYIRALSTQYDPTNAEKKLKDLGTSKDQLINGYLLALSSRESIVRSHAQEKLQALGASKDQIINGYLRDLSLIDMHDFYDLESNLEVLGATKEQISKLYLNALSSNDDEVFKNAQVKLKELHPNKEQMIIGYLGALSSSAKYGYNIFAYQEAEEKLKDLGASKDQMFNGYIAALSSNSDEVRMNALNKLVDLGDNRANRLLINGYLRALSSDAYDPFSGKKEYLQAEDKLRDLGASKDEIVDGYIAALSSLDQDVRANAINKLGNLRDKRAIEPLKNLLNPSYPVFFIENEEDIELALAKLGINREKMIQRYLVVTLSDDVDYNAPRNADEKLKSLVVSKEEMTEAYLNILLSSDRYDVFRRANENLKTLGTSKEQMINTYFKILSLSNSDDALGDIYKELKALGASENQMFNAYILALSSNSYIRWHDAVEELGNLGDKRAIETLKKLKTLSSNVFPENLNDIDEINISLAKLGDKSVFEPLRARLDVGRNSYRMYEALRDGGANWWQRHSDSEREFFKILIGMVALALGVGGVLGIYFRGLFGIKGFLVASAIVLGLAISSGPLGQAVAMEVAFGFIGGFLVKFFKHDNSMVSKQLPVRAMPQAPASKRSLDAAMFVKQKVSIGRRIGTGVALPPGGIDLNQIAIKRTGHVINVQFDQAQLAQLEQGGFEGFTPVIVNMTRISNLFQVLGISTPNINPKVI